MYERFCLVCDHYFQSLTVVLTDILHNAGKHISIRGMNFNLNVLFHHLVNNLRNILVNTNFEVASLKEIKCTQGRWIGRLVFIRSYSYRSESSISWQIPKWFFFLKSVWQTDYHRFWSWRYNSMMAYISSVCVKTRDFWYLQ